MAFVGDVGTDQEVPQDSSATPASFSISVAEIASAGRATDEVPVDPVLKTELDVPAIER